MLHACFAIAKASTRLWDDADIVGMVSRARDKAPYMAKCKWDDRTGLLKIWGLNSCYVGYLRHA
jgi:hypothetical protein